MGIFRDIQWLFGILSRLANRLKRLIRSPRAWKAIFIGGLALVLIAACGTALWPVGGEPRILHHLFGGNTTKQEFFGLGLAILVAGVIVPVTRMPTNLLRPRVWVALFVGLLTWNYGTWKVWHFIATNPTAGLLFIAGVTLIPAIVGFLFVIQKPPKRGSKFGKFNQPNGGR